MRNSVTSHSAKQFLLSYQPRLEYHGLRFRKVSEVVSEFAKK